MPTQYKVVGRTAKEIAESVEAGVRSDRLPPGAALPSVRALAVELDVAAGTVSAAYRMLRDRGVLETRGRGGTLVRARPALAQRSLVAPLPDGVRDLASGQPAPNLLPTLTRARAAVAGTAAAPDGMVLPELRELTRHRLENDGVPARWTTLAGGGLNGIARVLTAHLRPGDTVALEDPGWPNTLDLAAALGLRVHPLPVDAEGPTVDGLRRAVAAGARSVVVTTRAQNPTASWLTATRAAHLRAALAAHPDLMVVEDDHAAELASVPLATLSGATTSWAFVRSVSKPYGPDLRVSFLAGDERTIARVEGRMRIESGWVSGLLQRLTLRLMQSPEVTTRVARAGAAYDEQRAVLLDALGTRGIAAAGATGLNVWVPVADETAVVAALLRAGWAVAAGARFRQASAPGIRITVGDLDQRWEIPALADALADAVSSGSARYAT